MAKGDSGRAQNQIDSQGGLAQNTLNNTRDSVTGQGQTLWNDYLNKSQKDSSTLDEIQNQYRSFLSRPELTSSDAYGGYKSLAGGGGFSVDPALRARTDEALGGYSNFAKTGGYSDSDIQNLRARAIAPTRAIYANAQEGLDRNRAITGNSTGYGANLAKLARDSSSSISDANVNANASLADSIRSGKLAGLSGLSSTSLGQQSADTSLNGLNLGGKIAGLGGMAGIQQQDAANKLAGISGMSGLYGTAPGQSSSAANAALTSSGQSINLQSLQNQLAGLIMNSQIGKSQIPGDFQSVLGNIGSLLGLGGQIGSGISGLGGLFGIGGRSQNLLPNGDVGPVNRG